MGWREEQGQLSKSLARILAIPVSDNYWLMIFSIERDIYCKAYR